MLFGIDINTIILLVIAAVNFGGIWLSKIAAKEAANAANRAKEVAAVAVDLAVHQIARSKENAITLAAVASEVTEIKVHTNSLTTALVDATALASHAEGMKDEKARADAAQ